MVIVPATAASAGLQRGAVRPWRAGRPGPAEAADPGYPRQSAWEPLCSSWRSPPAYDPPGKSRVPWLNLLVHAVYEKI